MVFGYITEQESRPRISGVRHLPLKTDSAVVHLLTRIALTSIIFGDKSMPVMRSGAHAFSTSSGIRSPVPQPTSSSDSVGHYSNT
jgi:hypothetical protein